MEKDEVLKMLENFWSTKEKEKEQAKKETQLKELEAKVKTLLAENENLKKNQSKPKNTQ